MQVNIDWVYRKVHVFHILINIRTNKMLQISSALAPLFVSKSNFDYRLNAMRTSLSTSQRESLIKVITHLKQEGVLSDE